MSKRFVIYSIVLFVLLIITSILSVLLFRVQRVVINSDLNIKNESILNFLEINKGDFIWTIDEEYLEEKLSRKFIFENKDIEIKYPSTVIVTLEKRKPIAITSGVEGQLFVIDREGIVFENYKNSDTKEDLPFIIYQFSDKIKKGTVLSNRVSEIINLLWILLNSHKYLYDNISQIEITEKTNDLIYSVYFRTFHNVFVFRNEISVENITTGFLADYYLDSIGHNDYVLYSSLLGYYYKGSDL